MRKILLAINLLLVSVVFAQNSNSNPSLNFNITLLDNDPVIDGNILGESIWNGVPVISNLKQIKPNYGIAASEKTAIRIAYTAKTLYVAVVCYDTSPKNIVVSDSRRDADLNDDDSFLFSQLTDLCGVDWPEKEIRFEVVYNLLSMSNNCRE